MLSFNKRFYTLPSVFIFVILLIAGLFCLPVEAVDSACSTLGSPENIKHDDIEEYFARDGLDYYAYMDINTAQEELVPIILEARSRIISQTSWVADDLNGWVENCDGNIIEIVPKFHDIFPQDWEVPSDYGNLDD